MMRNLFQMMMILLLALGMVACDGAETEPAAEDMAAEEAPAEESAAEDGAALQITGMVNAEQAWTEEEVRAMDTVEAEAANKSGEMSTYTGVPVNDLLAEAGVAEEATAVVFVAGDGKTAEMSLDDLSGCADCILSFRNQGGFSTTLPGFDDLPRLRDVVEIQVK